MYSFCETQNILCENQYGFRPKHSIIDAVSKFSVYVKASLESNLITLPVFLDLPKAFDTIDHNNLLRKLHFYGDRGVDLEWFWNYLTNRFQFVSYHHIHSASHSVTCGVPQRSVMGRLLFTIYTNDLPHALTHSKCILPADDTTIYCTSQNPKELQRNTENDMRALSDC